MCNTYVLNISSKFMKASMISPGCPVAVCLLHLSSLLTRIIFFV